MTFRARINSIKILQLISLVFLFISINELDASRGVFYYPPTLFFTFIVLVGFEFLVIRNIKRKPKIILFNLKTNEVKSINDYVIYLLAGLGVVIFIYYAISKHDYLIFIIFLGPLNVWLFKINSLPIYIYNNRINFPQYFKRGVELSEITNAKISCSGKIEIKRGGVVEVIFIPEADTDRFLRVIQLYLTQNAFDK